MANAKRVEDSAVAFPFRATELTPARLTGLMRTVDVDASVSDFTVTDEKHWDPEKNEASSAGRLSLDLRVTGNGPSNGSHKIILKVRSPEIGADPLYRNEVNFYTHLRPELDIEIPRCFGAEYHPPTGTFGLAIEDLKVRGAKFPNVKTPVSLDEMRALLSTLARLHSQFWNSARLTDDLAFIKPHLEGEIYDIFNNPDAVPALVRHETTIEQFKRELVQAAGQTVDDLYRQFRKLQQHQSTLPQTICHGDTHIGNTYLLPDGTPGLLDWQLAARGFPLHDVTYLMVTGLEVAQRRTHEKLLLHYYRERLIANGCADVPDFETLWLEYRRAAVWGVYIGWLTTSIANYGWDITVCNHIRLLTAYQDLGTCEALADLPDAPAYSA